MTNKPNLVVLADGARWIWDYWTSYYPQATQILDYYHLVEKIAQWAVLVFKDVQQQEWIDVCQQLLLSDQAAEVVLLIQAVACKGDKKQKQGQLLTYLANDKDRIHYQSYLQQGLLIGSGPMEVANREVIQKRMNGAARRLSRQRWTRQGAQQVANLRVIYKSRKWTRLVENIRAAA